MTNKELWTAIWYAENGYSQKAADILRSFLSKKSIKSTKGKVKIAIVVGHNSKSQGAYAPYPVNMTEYKFNSLVAKELVKLANEDGNIEIKVFFRKSVSSYSIQIDEVYGRVNEWNPKVVLELHFNWLNQTGRIEMLHYPNSQESIKLGELLLDGFGDLIGNQYIKQLVPRSKNDRGGRSLWACKSPIILTEPFDCSNPQHLIKVEEVGAKGFAKVYFDCLKKYLQK